MDAPTDLDESVAKHVMGWQSCPDGFRPSSHWPDTRRVIDAIHRRIDDEDTIERRATTISPGYLTIWWTGREWAVAFNIDLPDCWWDKPGDAPFTGMDDSLERAVCLAALAVYGVSAE